MAFSITARSEPMMPTALRRSNTPLPRRIPIRRVKTLSVLAVAIGGALGSLFRWFLGVRLNGLFPDLPLGTLAANVIAGYVIGVAVAFFARQPDIPGEWRLFIITGLMGGLSTFSTFSAEVVADLQQGRLGWAAGEVAIHVGASLTMTILGIVTVSAITRTAAV
jgi:fluoride exporter